MRLWMISFAVGLSGLGLAATALSAEMSDEELIKNAMSAAPEAVARDATIVAMDEQGKMRTLKEGTSQFTCIADVSSPENPMCLDKNAMEWAAAWMNKTDPPKGKVGFGYMLAGGATPSNVDPFATEPPGGGEPAKEPPHVMIFSLPEIPEDYPKPGEEPDRSRPWVMWAGTPYEHLMIPVQ